jgi:hypothetical protein
MFPVGADDLPGSGGVSCGDGCLRQSGSGAPGPLGLQPAYQLFAVQS